MLRTHGGGSPPVTANGSRAKGYWRPTGRGAVALAPPEVDIRAPPGDLDGLIDWFDRVSLGLVLLEEYPRPDLVHAVDRLDAAVRDHLRRALGEGATSPPNGGELTGLAGVLASDHARFVVSLGQLGWFLQRVTEDEAGGHGQALGQYGRVLAEALRRHRDDERRFRAACAAAPPVPGGSPPGKP